MDSSLSSFSPYRILFVCTGNICRSPVAEAVMRHALKAAALTHRVIVDSAGTESFHIGQGPDRRAVIEASKRGVSMEGLVARQVKMADFDVFDLILAMDVGHMQALAHVAPEAARRKVKFFLEYAPSYSSSGGQRGFNVPDPYYGDARDFADVMDLIELGCAGLLKAVSQDILKI